MASRTMGRMSHPVDSADPASILAYINANRDHLALRHLPQIDRQLRRLEEGTPDEDALHRLLDRATAAADEVAAREALAIDIDYPDSLPVSGAREEILAAIASHPVTIIAGETGSGKTTQIPKMLLELGYGRRGLIGHTQPRRIAARNVARRLAEELDEGVRGDGDGRTAVGYKVRFSDQTRPNSRVAVMTDGLLLAELTHDRDLLRYDALIIDEAHERSLNIDFLLGVMKRLLQRRPDFRLIITSATIDPERFAEHFADDRNGRPPIISVSGRGYPVEVRYRPPEASRDEELGSTIARGVMHAVDELVHEGPGDILVFLPGEREIRETERQLSRHGLRNTEILPLYARLSASDQQRVFAPHAGRRIVLSTNVAETSLTVPGIHYVIDSGVARISRYHPRARLQKLGIEPVSQASANQRAGRCGRIAPGVCIRLFDEEDFDGRPAFTDPEILRSNLASVLLQLDSLKLGRAEEFPFIEPPEPRQLASARKHLFELRALDETGRLTEIGRRLSRLPIDPTLGRMIVAAREHGDRATEDMLVVAAFLALQDPRERPTEARGAADAAHRDFALADSDFASALALWSAWHEVRRHKSRRQARQWAIKRYLNANRLTEWHDLVGQLRQSVDEMFRIRLPEFEPIVMPDKPEEGEKQKLPAALAGRIEQLHQAALAGLLDHVGMRDPAPPKSYQQAAGDHRGKKRRAPTVYLGAHNRRFYLFPGSVTVKAQPKWMMAAEIVETSKVFARMNAPINPRWLEPMAGHLVTHEHNEPSWDPKSGRVTAFETVRLFGLPIVTKRRVDFGAIDPVAARDVFIRRALVEGDFESAQPFWQHNQALIEEIRTLEAKLRRPAFLVDDQVLYDFYQARVPADVTDARKLNHWIKGDRAAAASLELTRDDLLATEPDDRRLAELPDHWQAGRYRLKLAYHFAPGEPDDGVSLHVPLGLLNRIDATPTTHLVPGLRREKIEAMIRALPKAERRHFVPAPSFAEAVEDRITDTDMSLSQAVADELRRMTGHEVDPALFDEQKLDEHLRMRFVAVDEEGEPVDADRDINALRGRQAQRAQEAFNQRSKHRLEDHQATEWDFDELPDTLTVESAGAQVEAHPALVDHGDHVAIELIDDPERARRIHEAGVVRLMLLGRAQMVRQAESDLRGDRSLDTVRLHYSRLKSPRPIPAEGMQASRRADRAFDQELIFRAAWELAVADQPPIRDPDTFRQRLARLDGELPRRAMALAQRIKAILEHQHRLRRQLSGRLPLSVIEAAKEIGDQIDLLVHPGMIWLASPERLDALPRYLDGAAKRLEKTERQPERDRMQRVAFAPLAEQVRNRLMKGRPDLVEWQRREALLDLLEGHRLDVFAQELAGKGAPKAKDVEAALSPK
ncbi:ATP-dependent RNA helicase HrpA [Guyparkeria halophila]|uniref:ATP-dependent RNA helicase HrpA n=1 Tax=Guyparkeria halophila TaxID=47960 RepID=A0ABZ0YZS7_9GAMM|nr:ATP-dependent RNA helicase HrpA [Guyparkeria halophila]WQH16655.1 ATP-dependent RNA helicase HrpA [Guyparkeria halophila]